MPAAACVHCVAGLEPVKMKRQRVHHFSGVGRITVCADRHLKPEQLAAAVMTTHGPVTVATNGPDF